MSPTHRADAVTPAAAQTPADESAPPAAPAAIEARDLVVRRGRAEILHGVSFALAPGSITGLLGPSGCGKTTLLRALMGVQRITSGSARLLGLDAGAAQLRHRVAYTSQAVSIYRDITVRANVACFARLVGVGPDAVDRAIDAVELTSHADRRIDALSGGQAGRASLACALVGDPEVLILDEPTVGLDPLTRRSLWDTFHALAHRGTTLLISSHVMDEARRCDDALLMREGRILAQAPIEEIQRRTGADDPDDAFLALVEEDR